MLVDEKIRGFIVVGFMVNCLLAEGSHRNLNGPNERTNQPTNQLTDRLNNQPTKQPNNKQIKHPSRVQRANKTRARWMANSTGTFDWERSRVPLTTCRPLVGR